MTTPKPMPIPLDKLSKPPADAFVLTAKLMSNDQEGESHNVELLARTPNPLYHWWWGNIVHDMEGFFKHKDTITLDWNHNNDVLVGYADKQETTEEGLMLSGKLISLEKGDQADKIIQWKKHGVPLEASIYFDEAEMEYIPEDTTTLVNNQQFAGPGVVVRKWTIRGCAICPYGYDGKTETRMSRQFNFSFKGDIPVSTTENTEEQTKPAVLSTPEPSTEDALALVRNELKKFTESFGDAVGANLFQKGLSFTDAQSEFIKQLKSDIESKNQELANLQTQLSAFRNSLGESGGLETTNKGEGKRKFASNMTEARQARQ
jgi:hypothetical protein